MKTANPEGADVPRVQPQAMLYLPPATKERAEEQLFYFVRGLIEERPQAGPPLLVESTTLRALYADPNPDLVQALEQNVDRLLIQIDPQTWPKQRVTPALLGITLALYTALSRPLGDETILDPLDDFGFALSQVLPSARSLPDMLAYHSLLQPTANLLPLLTPARADLLSALIHRSPLSAATHLHIFMPPPLTPLAAESLHGWSTRVVSPAPWRDLDDWLAALALALAHPALAAHLRRQWLTMPESRAGCRNLGLLLEALRRQGNQRQTLLAFYEAYDYFAAEPAKDDWGRHFRVWPLLGQIERLLRVDGDSEAAIRLNRCGNEYFQKFLPLIRTVIDDSKQPPEVDLPRFNRLSGELIAAVRALMEWTPALRGSQLNLANIEYNSTFESEETGGDI